QGWEPEIRLAVEVIYPTWLLLQCLDRFARERPETRIELLETVLGGNEEALVQRKVHLAIGPVVPAGFIGDVLLPVRFVCMAAPGHPLHRLGRPATLEDLRQHRHLVIRDSGVQRTDRAWLNEQRWTVSHKATSIRAAVMGLGYSWYAEGSVREELERGTLKPLPLREGGERAATLHLVYADRDSAGPGTRRLAQIIQDETRAACKLEARRG
ncbi:MAG: substrate-binding domain-containing protein, partial [Burkholderiales bacterium]